MAVLSLPLSFKNSFWTPDYRKGLEVLYFKLEEGTVENDEILAFIRARAIAEGQMAASLLKPAIIGQRGTGFGADDGASLLMAFRGLQAESAGQGTAHHTIAKELHTLVADPFEMWARGYKERLRQSKSNIIDNWLHSYELAQAEVASLKDQYLAKTRRADEAEDDAKFAPNNVYGDKYTRSPLLVPHDARTPPVRSTSVSERIAERLRDIQRKSVSALSGIEEPLKPDETVFEVTSEGEKSPTPTSTPKIDKGKGKAIDEHEKFIVASPPPISPPLPPPQLTVEPNAPRPRMLVLLAGLSMEPSAISALLTRAKAELPLRPVRFPLLGEYQDCFHGEEFVAWLNQNVQGFGGNLDKAEEAARELTERDNLLRRIGELGNSFEHSADAFYQFRPKAFDLERNILDPANISSPTKNISPIAGNFLKRSNTLVNVVAKALAVKESEPAYIKARNEAEESDRTYRIAIRKLDRQRLGIEERIEETLKILQKWEGERLKAIRTVLLQYQGILTKVPNILKAIDDRSSTLVASYQPDNDLKALMERYRTGPFHPTPQVYESVAHDESDVVFGIDLRKWSEGGWETFTTGEQKKELYPSVLSALLDGLKEAYTRLPNDAEKRKAWIYDVPLASVHHLRESLNGVDANQPIPKELLANYDAPVIAGAIRLWVLELDPPLTLWEGWDEFRKLYPSVGSKANPSAAGEVSEQQHIENLSTALMKLPRIHLYVLDALISHFKNLIDSTPDNEDNEVYLTKLALSVGRTIIRPKSETEMTLHDRHPTLLFIDLVKNYNEILPPTITKKKRESERKVPLRKRTAPIDMRIVRGKIAAGYPTRELYAAQHAAQKAAAAVPPVPALPQTPLVTAAAQPGPDATLVQPISPPSPPKPENSEAVSPPPSVPAVPAQPAVVSDEPQRPSFKEPPPDDDLPPRPSFKEPPPEDDDTPLPMPNFAEPPVSPPMTPPPQPQTDIVPPARQSKLTPVPVKRDSLINRSNSPSPGTTKLISRSPSPADETLSSKVSLSRSASGQSGYVRGPRASHGPRAPGNVTSMVSSLNRNSIGSSAAIPSYTRKSASPSRPQIGATAQDSRAKGISRAQALSRRTMASDAEDEIVQ